MNFKKFGPQIAIFFVICTSLTALAGTACEEFQVKWKDLTTVQALPVADQTQLINAWPGVPDSTKDSFRFVLKHKNPPTEMDNAESMKKFSTLPTCQIEEVGSVVWSLTEKLSDKQISIDEKQAIFQAAKGFVEKISNDPLHLFKSKLSLSLIVRLTEARRDDKLNRKERQVRALASKFQDAGKFPDLRTPESLRALWSDAHEAEAIRMEVARILFFP